MTTRPANARQTNRPANARQTSSPADQFPAMIRIANQMGCQLRPAVQNPSMLRGLCPFHESDTIAGSKTLEIDARNPRFWCQKCGATGNPIAFAAMAWGVTARDAHQLLTENKEAGAERPAYPDRYHRANTTPESVLNAPQNSAILTRATRYYSQQARRNYPALHFMAKLGITPEQASKIGMGYCEGQGLRKHLLENGIEERETVNSPLFHELVDTETFADRIVLSDLDFTGATLWMASIAPEDPETGYAWRDRKPSIHGLSGRKMYLMNLYSMTSRSAEGVLTDDPRLYIVLAVNGIPTALITQRRRPNQNLEAHCERTAAALGQREVRKIILAMHDHSQREQTIAVMAKTMPGVQTLARARSAIMDELSPHTRDLERFMDFSRDDPQEDLMEQADQETDQETDQEENHEEDGDELTKASPNPPRAEGEGRPRQPGGPVPSDSGR